MMYLVFLGCLYVLHGGRLVMYLRAILGLEVHEEAAGPPAKKKGAETPPASDRDALLAPDGDGSIQAPATTVYGHGSTGETFASSARVFDVEAERGLRPGIPRSRSADAFLESGAHAGPLPGDEGGGSWDDEDGAGAARAWLLPKHELDLLKRRTITSRLQPLMILSSFASDLDLVTDWAFYHYVLVDYSVLLQRAGLVFAIVGTVTWTLSTTEFAAFGAVNPWGKNDPVSRLKYSALGWQLLANVFAEDLPQFVITIMTKPSSVTGVLNMATSVFSLMAKIVKGFLSTSQPSLSTQFKMIDADPSVTRNLFRLADEAKRKAKMAEKLVALTWKYRCPRSPPLLLPPVPGICLFHPDVASSIPGGGGDCPRTCPAVEARAQFQCRARVTCSCAGLPAWALIRRAMPVRAPSGTARAVRGQAVTAGGASAGLGLAGS